MPFNMRNQARVRTKLLVDKSTSSVTSTPKYSVPNFIRDIGAWMGLMAAGAALMGMYFSIFKPFGEVSPQSAKAVVDKRNAFFAKTVASRRLECVKIIARRLQKRFDVTVDKTKLSKIICEKPHTLNLLRNFLRK